MTCIVGECPVCKDWVYETEWSGPGIERFGKFIHEGECFDKFMMETKERRIIRRQQKELKELREEVERLTQDNAALLKGMGRG